MKKKSWYYAVFATTATLLCTVTTGFLASCGSGGDDSSSVASEDPSEGAGVYYYDAAEKNREYLITLSEGWTFSFAVNDTVEAGSYTLENETLTLLSSESKWTQTATLKNDEIKLVYEGADLTFLKKEYYTVNFETAGGNEVGAASVLNGKTLEKPADPVRSGYGFVGWYTDDSYANPFTFGTAPIRGDMTLYARWAEKPVGQSEYVVSYDAGYDGEKFESTQTIGGKLYNPAVPAAREGYIFKGWWVSMENDASRLSYKYEEPSDKTAGTTFDSDTTLFAVWQETGAEYDAPAVNVEANAVTWDSVGTPAYMVKVTAPDGSVVVDQRVTVTTLNVSFDMAGAYKVEVTAINAGGAAASDTTVRYFLNKALARVSGFTVAEPSVLVFQGVEKAEKYLITIDCGNKNHKHIDFDNGTSTNYNFINCDMQEGGIVFTVTAVAEGYAPSAATFIYERRLDAVQGLTVDADTVYWTAVKNATSYEVKIGEDTYTTTQPKFSLKAFSKGEYAITVTPKAKGYNSPAPEALSYSKTTLAAPADIRIVGTTVTWNSVEGATAYEIKIGDKTFSVPNGETSYDIAEALDWVDAADYKLSVKATGGEESSSSEEIDIRYNAMYATMSYSASVLTWRPVVGAVSYQVQINDGEIATVQDGAAFYEVATFTKEGMNTLKVRFFDGNHYSDWAETSVYAHALNFDSRGGSSVETLYKAVGDKLELPSTTKTGYEFADWYNAPGGPDSNGAAYSEGTFLQAGGLVLYAYYTPKAFDITLNYGEATQATETVYYNQADYRFMVPESNDGTRAFGGWYSAPYGAGIAYTDAKGNALTPWTRLEEEATVYAFWIDSVLKYTLIGNGYAVSKGDRIDLVTELTVPALYKGVNVTMLAGGAFSDCGSLTEINLPDTVMSISAETAFSGCSNLTAVNVYAVDGNRSVRYTSRDGVLFDNGDTANPHAPQPVFMPAAKTGEYRIPDGVEIIPRSAFANSKLSKIVIPASVKEIGAEAFANCAELTSIVFEQPKAGVSASALSIGDRAFLNCTELTFVTLPARLDSISLGRYTIDGETLSTTGATDAFLGCTNLEEINVAKGGTRTFSSADGVLLTDNESTLLYFPAAKNAENYAFPAGVTKIADGAFFACDGLISGNLEIPGRITYVGECAFYDCYYIDAVTFMKGVSDVTVGAYAFRDSGIQFLTFEEGSRVTELGKGAFYNCEYLADGDGVVIPATMQKIGDKAFYGCGSIDVVITEGKNELSFGDDVFYGCEIDKLTLPKNITALPNFLNGLSLSEIEVPADHPVFTTVDGVLYSKDSAGAPEILLLYPSGKGDSSFVVPDTVTTIADGAFKGQYYLETITVSASVTKIGNEAFSGSSLGALIFAEGGTEDLEIGDYAFYNNRYLETAELPERAKTLGAYSFANARWLDTITLGGVVTIGDYAFKGAGGYGEIVIPASVETIGQYSFAEARFSSVTFAENSKLRTIGDYAFAEINDWDELEDPIVIPASVTFIGNYAFYYVRTSSITFEAESKLEVIGAYAFAKGYHEIFTIPASVKSIGAYAFYGNSYLETVVFEDGDVDLEFGTGYDGEYGHVFASCGSLTVVNFPGRLTVLGESAFEDNSYIEQVTFGNAEYPSRLTTIGANAFYWTGLTSIVIPASVKNTADRIAIGENAFYGCELTEVTFEEGGSKDTAPLTIGNSAFASNYDLTAITLPSRLASFTDASGSTFAPFANGSGVFANCGLTDIDIAGDGESEYVSKDGVVYTAGYLELVLCPKAKNVKVTVPSSVTKIADKAFYECNQIPEVEFESGSACTEIGAEAFYRCYGLESLVLPANIKTIGYDAFFQCKKLVSLTLPADLEAFDSSIIAACSALQNLNVGEGSKTYKSVDGVLFTADGKKLICYLSTRNDTEYSVPEGVEEIGVGAFNSNNYLEKVTLPKSLTLVGESAFNSCFGLTTAVFTEGSDAALVLAVSAFQNSGLTSISLPARVTAIGDTAFYACSALESIAFAADGRLNSLGDSVFARSGLVSVTLPQGLIEIGEGTFSNCASLTTVTLSEGLTKIGKQTFNECSKLITVNLPASLIELGDETFKNCRSLENINFAPSSQIAVIPNGTFMNCTSLESIELPASLTEIPDKDADNSSAPAFFQGCTSLKRVTFAEGSKCVKIGSLAFRGTALEQFTIPASVTSIGNNAFDGTNLTSIIIPKTVTKLGAYLFQNCASLTYVRLDATLTTLPDSMFENCTNLTSFTIPATVTGFASSVFSGCTALASVDVETGNTSFIAKSGVLYTNDWEVYFFPAAKDNYEIPKEVTSLPEGFFEKYGIKTIAIENGNTAFTLEDEVLYNADKTEIIFLAKTKTSFTIPAALTSEKIVELLKACSSLENIAVEEGNEAYQVKFGALYDMQWNLLVFPAARTEYVIPKEVTLLPDGAFAGTKLVSVTYENGGTAELNLATDEVGAFQNCAYLETVDLPSRTKLIDGLVFAYCPVLKEVNLPDSVNSIKYLTSQTYYSPFYNCPSLEEINVDARNESYRSFDGVLYDGNWGLLVFPVAKTSFMIPHEVTNLKAISSASKLVSVTFEKNEAGEEVAGEALTLANYMFEDLDSLRTVELPSRVAALPDYMFSGCTALESVSIPASVTSLGKSVFEGCSSLSRISVAEGNTALSTDENGILYKTNENGEGRSLYLIPAALKLISYTIPKDVTFIAKYSFVNTGVQKVDFEDGGTLQLTLEAGKYERVNGRWSYTGVFADCTSLTSVKLPERVASIPAYTFYGCETLAEFSIPATVTFIGGYAFSDCALLKNIYIPTSVLEIEYCAFAYWTKAQTIEVGFAQDSIPAGWESGWQGRNGVNVNYGVASN